MSRALRVPPPLTAAGIRGLLAIDDLPHDDVLTAIAGHYGGAGESADPPRRGRSRALRRRGHALRRAGQAPRGGALPAASGSRPTTARSTRCILPAALVTRRADPLVISMIGHEIARRAGLESHVCIAGADSWTAVLDAENCTLVGASPFTGADARRGRFHVACAHETATVLLERIAAARFGRTRTLRVVARGRDAQRLPRRAALPGAPTPPGPSAGQAAAASAPACRAGARAPCPRPRPASAPGGARAAGGRAARRPRSRRDRTSCRSRPWISRTATGMGHASL